MNILFSCLALEDSFSSATTNVPYRAGRVVLRQVQARGEVQYPLMARGWESKSVEAQQEEAGEKLNRSGRRKLSAEEAASFRVKENLRLARQRVLQQLEASSNPQHRKMLEDALAAVEEKLGQA